MTEAEEKAKRRRDVLKRLRQTRRGETICLAWWEIELLLEQIDERKGGAIDGDAEV